MRVALLGEATKRHVIDWANWLTAQGVEVHVCSDSKPKGDDYVDAVTFHHPHWSLLQNIATFKLRPSIYANNRDKWKVYLPLIQKIKPDIVHAQEALGYGPILPYIDSVPKVLTPWGPEIESVSNDTGEAQHLIRRAMHAADCVTTNGPGIDKHWSSLCGVALGKFQMFSWGVDTALFQPATNDEVFRWKSKWNLPLNKRILIYPRIPLPLYRHQELYDAWSTLEEIRRPALVFLSGGFSIPESLKRDEHSDFMWIDQELSQHEMRELYCCADFTAMIPKTDLLAQSLLECLACGSMPLLVENVCYRSAVSSIDDESHLAKGIYWEGSGQASLSESIITLMNLSDETCGELSQHNRCVIESQFEMNQCRGKMIELYEQLKSALP